ncbi:MAG: Hsp20/alpha crystallin family protein [Promethearchaeota archaeon]
MSDDFDDFIDRIKKYFKLDSNMFDIDFLFLPESEIQKGGTPDNEKLKGFKISYHFESGMDKPEIKIKSNIDRKKLWEYLKDADLSKLPNVKELYRSRSTKEIDADKLSLDFRGEEGHNELVMIEPYTEVCDTEGITEVLIEIPGIDQENVEINFRDKGRKLDFKAFNEKRKYMKTIELPFQASEENCETEVKNGIAILKLNKKPIKY